MTKLLAALSIAASLASGVQAATLTFGTLSGIDGDPFTTVTENRITATSASGAWSEAHVFGNPVPSIHSGPGDAGIDVTMGGGSFKFQSVDVAIDYDRSTFLSGLTIRGYLLGTQVFNLRGRPQSSDFSTYGSFWPIEMDLLKIDMVRGFSINIDNIVLDPVPEPSTYALVAAGLSAVALLRRRRA